MPREQKNKRVRKPNPKYADQRQRQSSPTFSQASSSSSGGSSSSSSSSSGGFYDPEGFWADGERENIKGKGPERIIVESEAYGDTEDRGRVDMVRIFDVQRGKRMWYARDHVLNAYPESYRNFRVATRSVTKDEDKTYKTRASDPYKVRINTNLANAVASQREKRISALGYAAGSIPKRFLILDSADFGTSDTLARMLPERNGIYTRIDVCNHYAYESMIVTPTDPRRRHYPIVFRNPASYMINYEQGSDRDSKFGGVNPYEVVYLDYCGTYYGSIFQNPRKDVEDMFKNGLLCDYSIFAITIAARNPLSPEVAPIVDLTSDESGKLYMYNVTHALCEIPMLAEKHGYFVRPIFDEDCGLTEAPEPNGTMVYRRATMAHLIFAVRKIPQKQK